MTNSNLKFKSVSVDKLFYGQWQYCMRASLPEVSSLRNSNFDVTYINEILDQRQRWRSNMQGRWFRGGESGFKHDITDQMRSDLHDFANFLIAVEQPYKMVISMSNMWIYTNDPNLLKKINSLPYLRFKSFSQAVIDRPVDTVLLRNPRHHYRCYLRGIKLTPTEKQHIKNFLKNYDNVRVSPGLFDFLENDKYKRTMDYYFVDHSDTGWEVLLGLIKPGIIRKTMQIMAK